jgi:tRNA A-37 threonylcarbamoyl transferase component Bud32
MGDTDREIARVLATASLADQRRRWAAGDRRTVESYLQAHPTLAADPEAVLDLIYQEVVLREERGETADVDEYLRRFPQWSEALRVQFEVHGAIQQPNTADAAPHLPHHDLDREIGRGAMGIVYRARDRRDGRTVAVKMLLPEHFDQRPALRRFLAETRAAARLEHPHIVPVHEVGESAAGPYLVMELIDGPSLAAVLECGPMAINDAVTVMIAVADAIEHAHRRGVIHRDLKPSNILLEPVRGPMVLDFGMAKVQRQRPGEEWTTTWAQAGAVMGTPAFMPPEQAGLDTVPVGPYSDVYSLGAILYALLTGRPPFVEETALRTIYKVQSPEPAPPVRSLRAEVPEALEQVCMRCLCKDQADRYRSASVLAEALHAVQSGDAAEQAGAFDPTAPAFLVAEATERRLSLAQGRTTVGRGEGCDIRVRSATISRRHCCITVQPDRAEIEDLGSSWGTRVNDLAVERAALADGDHLEIGGHSFVFRRC